MGCKKKTHKLNPENENQEVEIQVSKRKKRKTNISKQSNERDFRDKLSKKVNSTVVGLWFLAAEHLRLGSWDLIKGFAGPQTCDVDIDPRIAMQIVNEASLCKNRVRCRY